jgi:hypothetical protein
MIARTTSVKPSGVSKKGRWYSAGIISGIGIWDGGWWVDEVDCLLVVGGGTEMGENRLEERGFRLGLKWAVDASCDAWPVAIRHDMYGLNRCVR